MAGDNIRIGDAERDQAASMLREHHAEGRLSVDEFNERLDKALTARVMDDLLPLFADLPSPRPDDPGPGSATSSPYGYLMDPSPPLYGAVPGPQPVYDPYPVTPDPGIQQARSYSQWQQLWWLIPTIIIFLSIFGGASQGFGLIPFAVVAFVVVNSMKRRRQQQILPLRPLTFQENDHLLALIASHRQTEAISQYQAYTGADFYTAKQTIEMMGRQLG